MGSKKVSFEFIVYAKQEKGNSLEVEYKLPAEDSRFNPR